MKKYNFGRPGLPIPTYNIIKFILGWNALGIAFYQFAWKPKVKQKTEEAGYDWDKLNSTQKYSQFIGKDLAELKVKRYSLSGTEEVVAVKSDEANRNQTSVVPTATTRNIALCATKDDKNKNTEGNNINKSESIKATKDGVKS